MMNDEHIFYSGKKRTDQPTGRDCPTLYYPLNEMGLNPTLGHVFVMQYSLPNSYLYPQRTIKKNHRMFLQSLGNQNGTYPVADFDIQTGQPMIGRMSFRDLSLEMSRRNPFKKSVYPNY